MLKGHKVFESCKTGNLRDAEMILAKRKSELIKDVVLSEKKSINLHAAIDEYVATRVTPASKRNAASSMKIFRDALPNQPLKKLDKSAVDTVIQGLIKKFKPNTVQMRIHYWNAFANYCIASSYMIFGKIANIKNAKNKIVWLTPEEQQRLLAVVHPSHPYPRKSDIKDSQKQNNYDLLVFLMDTGVRYTEAAAIHWSQIDLAKGHIHIMRQKGGANTILSITHRLREVLTRRTGIDDTFVFPTKCLTNNNSTWMKDAVKRAGLKNPNGTITLHTMRHSFASNMLQNGVSLVAVSHLLGHSSIATTTKYAHLIKQVAADDAAAILNKLNAIAHPAEPAPYIRLVPQAA
jgi:integrase